MKTYLYPQNLKATASLWLWSLKDFAILCVGALLSVVLLVQFLFVLPAALTLCYGFLTIRLEQATILDHISFAVRFFLTSPQHFEWR